MITKKELASFFTGILIVLSLSLYVFAAGSGGGGGSPRCSEDTWSCSPWSECNPDSVQTRQCEQTYDCSGVDTPKPTENQPCQYASTLLENLKCQSQPTLKERVNCRIESPEEAERELSINYLPEECRALTSVAKKEECVKRYITLRRCFESKNDKERSACAKKIVGLGDMNTEIAKCLSGKNDENAGCFKEIEERVDTVIKFRFYNLEEKAEELLDNGRVSKDTAVEFVSSLEMKKQEYNNAKTIQEKKQIVLDVKSLWGLFIEPLKNGDDKK